MLKTKNKKNNNKKKSWHSQWSIEEAQNNHKYINRAIMECHYSESEFSTSLILDLLTWHWDIKVNISKSMLIIPT